ncbi:ribonuclease HI family protein [Candidatus Dependentiae bacterium]|nr:ribonuclease HI family protein [Candidatus Dependentiae bacterium]
MKQLNFFSKDEVDKDSSICTNNDAFKLYIDGASRNNPGMAGVGFCLMLGEKVLCEQGFFIGKSTNNQAEYMALLVGIFFSKEFVKKTEHLAIFSDSQLLIRQMCGQYRVKDLHLQKLQKIAQDFLMGYTHSFCHVYREFNQRADELANRGLDKKIPLPKKFLDAFSLYV